MRHFGAPLTTNTRSQFMISFELSRQYAIFLETKIYSQPFVCAPALHGEARGRAQALRTSACNKFHCLRPDALHAAAAADLQLDESSLILNTT